MSSVKEAFKALDQAQRSQLMYAFEQGITQLILLPGKRFIGVNVHPSEDHIDVITEGAWTIGKVK